jgi:SAM-dependent methyltransferase
MEYVYCDLCGRDDAALYLERGDRFSTHVFQYVVCQGCGLIYLNPRPDSDSLLSYYPTHYEAYQPLQTLPRAERWKRLRAVQTLARFVCHYRANGRLLDIGCGTGEFLHEMQKLGWEVEGIEPNNYASAIAKKYYYLRVFVGPVEKFESPQSTYDVITMWDVLEHLSSPSSIMRRVYYWLRDDGILIFSTPNIMSFDAYLFGKWWIGWDAPRHLYLFPPATLNRLLNQTGFRIIAKRCILGVQGSFRLSYQFWLSDKPRLLYKLLKPLEAVFPVVLWPYKQLSYLLQRGPIITIVAQKS